MQYSIPCAIIDGAVPLPGPRTSLMPPLASYGVLSGTVTTEGVATPACRVYAFNRKNGTLLAATWSNASGNFAFPAIFDISEPSYFVVAVDPDTGINYNALIQDRLTAAQTTFVNVIPETPLPLLITLTSAAPAVLINAIIPNTGTLSFTGGQQVTNAFTGSITPTCGMLGFGDPYASKNVLLLHMNGERNTQVFPDVTGKTITPFKAKLIEDISKFGGACMQVTDDNCYVSVPTSSDFDYGSGDVTIEMWVYRLTTTSAVKLFGADTGVLDSFDLFCSANSNFVSVQGSINGISYGFQKYDLAPLTPYTWTHVALVRRGTVLTLFTNGVPYLVTATLGTNVLYYRATARCIGGYSTSSYAFCGYIDEVRVTKGAARYTGPFTPPGEAFPDAAGVAPLVALSSPVITPATRAMSLSVTTPLIITDKPIAPSVGALTLTGIAPTRAP
jgi:hypothetical protein